MHLFTKQGISTSLMVFPRTARTTQSVREGFTEPTVDVIIFSWCSRGFIHFIYFIHFDNFIHLINSFIHSFIRGLRFHSFIERNLKKWILSTKSSCIGRYVVHFGVLQKIFPKMHVVKAAWLSQALWRFDSTELKLVAKAL